MRRWRENVLLRIGFAVAVRVVALPLLVLGIKEVVRRSGYEKVSQDRVHRTQHLCRLRCSILTTFPHHGVCAQTRILQPPSTSG